MLYFMTNPAYQGWYYDQALSASQSGLRGYCAGMVVRWIMLRSKGLDFVSWDDGGTPSVKLTDDDMNEIMIAQDSLEIQSGRSGYDLIFQSGEMTVPKGRTHRIANDDKPVELKRIPRYVIDHLGDAPFMVGPTAYTWYLMRLRPPGNGAGHVVAIEVSGTALNPRFRLMDPNNGCFVFPDKATFKTWLTTVFFPKSAYLELYTGFVKIHPITPRTKELKTGGIGSFFSSLFSM